MKTLISIISIFMIVSVNSYSQNSKGNALLEKPATRKEIFSAILNNQNYCKEFIQDLHGNQQAMMMIKKDNHMADNQGQMGMRGNSSTMNNSGQMGMNKDSHMGMNQEHMGMNGTNNMMSNQSQMGMYGNNPMMNHSYMMNMMIKSPGVMEEIMNNMMNVASTDTTMTHAMIDIMASHPQMFRMMEQQINNEKLNAELKKK